MTNDWILPPLPTGACLGVVAPAGPPREGTLPLVVPMIERLGFRAKIFPGCQGPAALGHLAAGDAQRLQDLHAAFADPAVDAVIGVRGGYGCMRLLDQLDMTLLRQSTKPLIGYSDLTALHAVRQSLGHAGWHAPMPASDWHRGEAGWSDALALAARLHGGLRAGQPLGPAVPPHPLDRPGPAVAGVLAGGNLAVLVALMGTPFMPDLRGAVLFLEDVGEDPYKVDRLLCQLRLGGHLAELAGVVLGNFSEADPPHDVMADYLHPLGCPVLAGWPAGHATPHLPLPLGARVRLDPGARSLTALQLT
ncbi:muramoyltetrapeptide carboxypeptidase [Roseateles sp. YR242]|uniref:S66 peptidase family protein n=1 Tax=Roseateles sp. YR242 TaxID=1855305 RepID=UPI0008B7FCBE|nr:LD-carboxypeptidase [Roseateles sp. YR242]SEK81351.1 muramoyltetrapeptide carboxypeptidase [Roseateles sp. YR242]